MGNEGKRQRFSVGAKLAREGGLTFNIVVD
jgi:hypothetical protein